MTDRAKHWAFDVASAFIAAPFAILLYWIVSAAIDRQPPVIYERVGAVTASAPQGGQLEVEFSVFRLRICPADVRRWLIDSAGVRHSIPQFTVGPRLNAGLDTYRRTITIPDAAAVGPAVYTVDLDYYCNPLQRLGWPISVTSPPIDVEVTPRPLILLPPLLAPAPDGDG
jgi:hypothetical protein